MRITNARKLVIGKLNWSFGPLYYIMLFRKADSIYFKLSLACFIAFLVQFLGCIK